MKTFKLLKKRRCAFFLLSCFLIFFSPSSGFGQSVQVKRALSKVSHNIITVVDQQSVVSAEASSMIPISKDEVLVLKLWANPSTGYQWEIEGMDQSLLEMVDVPLHESVSRANMPGASVWQHIYLKSKGRGSSSFKLVYRRPWDPISSKEDEVKVRVDAQGVSEVEFSYSPTPNMAAPIPKSQYNLRGLPSYFDWRDQNAVTPVRSQGSCGSCWAFGSTAGFEAKIQMKHGTMPDLSEQYLVSCNNIGGSCAGGWWAHDLWYQYVPPGQDGAGAVYEQDFPYQALDVECKPVTHHEQLEGWGYTDDVADSGKPTKLHAPTVAQIKQKLYQWGPIPTALCIDNWGAYTGGVLSGSSSEYTNHIVLITGWDDANQCWIIKNSWGADWGEDGYIRIAYGSHLSGQYSTYLKYDKDNPRMVFQGSQFYEAIPNNGEIRKPITGKLLDAGNGFALVNQELTAGVHYSMSNLPAGLTPKVKTIGADKIQITLEGSAYNHLDANDALFTLDLFDNVFADYGASEIEFSTYSFNIDFFNPYQLVYNDITDYTIDANNTWEYFTLENGEAFGLWYSYYYDPYPTKIQTFFLETYTKKAVCNTSGFSEGDRMLTPMSYGDVIDGNTNYFVIGGSYGDQHRITNQNYTDWNGKTSYVGFSFSMYGGTCYGWFRIQVSSSGNWVKILDYAYNEKPFAPIKAGFKNYEAIQPIADFKAKPLITFVGEEVDFTDCSERDPDSWNWTFNGGTPPTSTQTNPSIVYNAPGDYNVSLQVSNSGGSSTKTKAAYIKVYPNEAPQAKFEAPTIIPINGVVEFKDVSSNLPSEWAWEFEGGQPSTSTEQNPKITYANPGVYMVKLTASNQFGSNSIQKQAYLSVGVPPEGYCAAKNDMPDNYHILGVQLSNLNSSSEGSSTGYENHLSEYAHLEKGNTYDFAVAVENSHWPYNALGIWIDWNKDGDFDDAEETVFSMEGTGVYSGTVQVPDDAQEGITRMRVRIHYSKTPYPCGDDTYQGEVEDYSIIIGEMEQDVEPPTIPSNLSASVENLKVSLTWNSSSDNVGVYEYQVYADNALIGTSSQPSYTTSNLSPLTTYAFKVRAVDNSGNYSNFTAEVEATTAEEIILPVEYCTANNANDNYFYIKRVTLANLDNTSTKSGQGYENYTSQTANLSKGQNYNINVEVMNDHWTHNALGIWIDWNRDGDFDDNEENILSTKSQGIYSTSFTVPSFASDQAIRMRVRIHYDKTPYPCGHDTYQGEVEDYTISLGGELPPDTQAPSVPTGLAGTVSGQDISLSWNASTDNVGVSIYHVYMNNQKVQEVSTTSCSISGLSANQSYSFQVRALDAAGNMSNLCSAINLTTEDNQVVYCSAKANSGPEHIKKVEFVDLLNESGASQYSDYTNMTAHFGKNGYQLLKVTVGNLYSGDNVSAYFDWNRDGDFDDDKEKVDLQWHTSDMCYQWVWVPESASSNKIRMRVRVYYYSAGNKACGDNSYGEVEDYSIMISPGGSPGSNINIGTLNNQAEVRIYPNPSDGLFKISTELSCKQETMLVLYNVLGVPVYSDKITLNAGKFEKELRLNLPQGMYTLRMINSEVQKIIPIIIK
ncbi:MAG: GEVED domain-containing protein [Bacteroidales bacterium]